jgi:hypothetical protein
MAQAGVECWRPSESQANGLTDLLNEAATRKIEYPVTRVLPLLSVEKG